MADVSFILNSSQAITNPDDLARVFHQVSGVSAVHIDPANARATISYNPEKVDTFMLVSAVHDAGYSIMTESITLFVTGMTCTGCVYHVESALTDVPGVTDVDIDLQSGRTIVNVVTGNVELNTLNQTVKDVGYQVNVPGY